MNPAKGVHTAARVARAAGVPLRIAAKMREPAERDYFVQRVRPLLGGDLEYVGEVGGAEKLELLAGAACLLNPIAWPEPFGMVMIEALACGTPVVATPSGAAPEIVDDGRTGYLRRGQDALTAVMARAASLDRDACRRAVKERFSATRMVEAHLALYQRALWTKH
jgi:glycosyltransferase involved in cell wall biosynthesis